VSARVLDLDVVPEERDVLRLLGHREGETRIEAPMRRLIAEQIRRGPSLIRPRVALCAVDAPSRFGSARVFERVERLVLGIATIGPDLETEAERMVEAKELAAALVLDAYGSAAVEAAAVRANAIVCEEADAESLVAGRRLSPGYPRWPIDQQAALFAEVGGRAIDVALNESFVMTPRKSISFGVPLGRDLDAESPELGCRFCPMASCAYRRHAPTALRDAS